MLLAHLAARDPARPLPERIAALRTAAALAQRVAPGTRSPVQASTAARVLHEWGDRSDAANALLRLVPAIAAGSEMRIDAPFLPPLATYDSWAPAAGLGAWFNAGVFEAVGRMGRYSSFFREFFPQPVADIVRPFGRATAPLERQRQLRRVKDGDQAALEPHALLRERRVDNLNPAIWCGSTSGA